MSKSHGTVRNSTGGMPPRKQLCSLGTQPVAPGLRKPDIHISDLDEIPTTILQKNKRKMVKVRDEYRLVKVDPKSSRIMDCGSLNLTYLPWMPEYHYLSRPRDEVKAVISLRPDSKLARAAVAAVRDIGATGRDQGTQLPDSGDLKFDVTSYVDMLHPKLGDGW